jgi:hypothetical protein
LTVVAEYVLIYSGPPTEQRFVSAAIFVLLRRFNERRRKAPFGQRRDIGFRQRLGRHEHLIVLLADLFRGVHGKPIDAQPHVKAPIPAVHDTSNVFAEKVSKRFGRDANLRVEILEVVNVHVDDPLAAAAVLEGLCVHVRYAVSFQEQAKLLARLKDRTGVLPARTVEEGEAATIAVRDALPHQLDLARRVDERSLDHCVRLSNVECRISMMPFTLITSAILASYIETINYTLLRGGAEDNDFDENTLSDKDIDNIFAVIMHEISKIEKSESSDVNYTKIIIGLLILITLFTLKTKIYRVSTCCWRRKKLQQQQQQQQRRLHTLDAQPLENITIQELNYNVIADHHHNRLNNHHNGVVETI